jgi:N6-adenosine-specific RNA methylase IME4
MAFVDIFNTDKKYNIIYADPPWSYSDKRATPGKNNPHGAGGAEKHYKTMATQDICNLPIKDIADENCMLFMWTTSPMMFEAEKVIKAWGFDYKTFGFVWVKMTNDMSKVRGDGIGNYTIQNAEYCLIGLKGKYWRNKTGVKQILLAPKQEHSKKPNEARTRIVDLCGDLPRIELFARQHADGWDCFGNEV